MKLTLSSDAPARAFGLRKLLAFAGIVGTSLLALAAGCTPASDASPGVAEGEQRETPVDQDEVSREAARDLLDRAARGAAADGGVDAAAEPELGGSVIINDNQLTNSHDAFVTFFKNRLGATCGTFNPVDGGGECFVFQPCNPPNPPFMLPTQIAAGAVEVSSTFDTIRLEPFNGGTFYPRVSRPGPFWRGDGDFVSFSIAGVPGVVPAASFRERAPVGDVLANVPSPFEREADIKLGWNYADGAEKAVGHLLVRLFQQNAGGGASITCRAPLANRAITLPKSMLTRFVTGPATMTLASVANGTSFLPFEQGNVRLSLTLASVVDTGEVVEAGQPNVSFR